MFRRCVCQLLIASSTPVVRSAWQVPCWPTRHIRTQKFDPRLFNAVNKEEDEEEEEDDDSEIEEGEDDSEVEKEEEDDDTDWETGSDDDGDSESESERESESGESNMDSDMDSDRESGSESESEHEEIDGVKVKKADMFIEGDDAWEKKFLEPFYDKKLVKSQIHNIPMLKREELRSRRKLMRLTSARQDRRKKPRKEQKKMIETLKKRLVKIEHVYDKLGEEKTAAKNGVSSIRDSDDSESGIVSNSSSSSRSRSAKNKIVSALDSELDEEEEETVRLQDKLRKVRSGEIKVTHKERETLIASCKNAAPLYYDGAGRPVYVPVNYEEERRKQEEEESIEREEEGASSRNSRSKSSRSKEIDSGSGFEYVQLTSNNHSTKKELGKLTGGVSITEPMKIVESDLKETFVRSRGPGGQHVNKVNSCVDLVHVPTGTRVKCMQSRHQAVNRKLARKIMEERLAELFESKETTATKKMNKVRRQKSRRLRRLTQPPAGLKAFLRNQKIDLSAYTGS